MGDGLEPRMTEDALNVIKVLESTVAEQAIEADKLLICGPLELNKHYEDLTEERLGGNGPFAKYRKRGIEAAGPMSHERCVGETSSKENH